MMTTLIHSITLAKRRDIVIARRQARQIASFLGFDDWDALTIAAATFDTARRIFCKTQAHSIQFEIDNDTLVIRPMSNSGENAFVPPLSEAHALRKRIPNKQAARVAPEDVAWIMDRLGEHETNALWEEVLRQNQEILSLLLRLQRLERKMGLFSQNPQDSAA